MAQAKPRSKAKPKPQPETQPQPSAAAAASPRVWTYEDYCAIPDDGLRYEVIRGQLYDLPVPPTIHQPVLGCFIVTLGTHVDTHGLGELLISPLDVRLGSDSTVQPDLLFIRKERLEIIGEACIEGAPDLVIEVLSDYSAARDRSLKRDLYADNGVPFYWIFAPRTHSIEEYQLAEGSYQLVQRMEGDEVFEPQAFPGLRFSLSELRQ